MSKKPRALGRFVVFLAGSVLAAACNGGATRKDGEARPSVPATEAPTPDPSVCERMDRVVVTHVSGLDVLWGTGGTGDCGYTADVGVPDAPPEVLAAVEEGFIIGVSRAFIHPKIDPAKGNYPSGYLVIHSAASAYEDDASAQAALEVVLEEWGETKYMSLVGDPALGDAGLMFEGRLPYLDDIPRRFFAWRSGSILLYLYADGSIEVDADRVRAIAEGMQARAVEG